MKTRRSVKVEATAVPPTVGAWFQATVKQPRAGRTSVRAYGLVRGKGFSLRRLTQHGRVRYVFRFAKAYDPRTTFFQVELLSATARERRHVRAAQVVVDHGPGGLGRNLTVHVFRYPKRGEPCSVKCDFAIMAMGRMSS